jgi:hypothetical protein
MYRRLLTSLTVMCAVAGLVVVPMATAREMAPPLGPVSKPLPAPAQQMLTFGRGELGPSPVSSATPVTSSGGGFDWNDAGVGAALVLSVVLVGAGGLVTIRRHHPPIAH